MPAKKKPAAPKEAKGAAKAKPAPPEPKPEVRPPPKPVDVRIESMTIMEEPQPRPRREEPRPAEAPAPKKLPRLDGKTILIAGGTGHVGSLLTAVCLGSGARVVVPSRSDERLATLRGKLSESIVDRFVPVVGSLSDVARAQQLRDAALSQVGRLDGVVTSLGSFWEGPELTELSDSDWRRAIDDSLTTQFIAARTFLPVLQRHGKGGSYVIINGSASEVPALKSVPVSVAQAGVHMLARILAEEVGSTGIHVEELIYASTRFRAHWLLIDGLMREALHVLATGSRST